MTALPKQLQALWVAILVQVLGRIGDGIWHLNHDDFEGAADQLEAHFVVWTGMLMTLVASAWALWGDANGRRRNGYLVTFVGAALYVPVAVWHFIGHANGEDIETAHILLAVTQIATIVGAAMATLSSDRRVKVEATER